MGVRTTTLEVKMIDGVSGPGAAASRALSQLGVGAVNLRGILGGLGIALGTAEMVRFGKESVLAYAAHERGLIRLQNITGASMAAIKAAHEQVVQTALKFALPGDAVADLEAALSTMVRMRVTLNQALALLPKVAELSNSTGIDVKNLAMLGPMMINSLHMAPEAVAKGFEAIHKAVQGMPGEAADMAAGLNSLMPQLHRIGWASEEGLNKLIGYVRGIAPTLGSMAPAFSFVADAIAMMTTKKLQKRIDDAYGEQGYMARSLAAAKARGQDEMAAFVEIVDAAVKKTSLGRVFINPEQQKAFVALKQNIENIKQGFNEAQTASDEMGAANARVLEGAQAKVNQLATAWTQFKEHLGGVLVDAGALRFLDTLRDKLTGISSLLHEIDQKGVTKTLEDRGATLKHPFGQRDPFGTLTGGDIVKRVEDRLKGWSKSALPPPPAPAPLNLSDVGTVPPPAAPAPLDLTMPQSVATVSQYNAAHDRRRAPAPPPSPMAELPPNYAEMFGAFDPMPEVAKQAGTATGQAYNAALGTELNKAVKSISEFANWMGKTLGVRASPNIAPSFSTAPGTAGAGAKATALGRGAFANSGPVPTH